MMEETGKEQPQYVEDLSFLDQETPWYLKIYYWFYRQASGLRFKLLKELPCFFQRGKNGYSYIDAWSFDMYLCGVIMGGIKILKKNLHGAPVDLFDKKAENPTWKWEETLDKIHDGFAAAKSMGGSDFVVFDENDVFNKEETEEKYKELEVKYNEGMDLFKKYFFSLWD